MADDKDKKDEKDVKGKRKTFKDFDADKYVDLEPTIGEELEINESCCDECGCDLEDPDPSCDCTHENDTNEAILTRMQRRQRGITMRKNRFKIKRGREKAARRMASTEVLKKRSRKQAIMNLKKKFSKNKRYAELSAGEKVVIDKRISKLPASRLTAMARKLLPSVKQAERDRKTTKKESLDTSVETSLDESAMWGQRQGKRPHMLLDKNNKVKFDQRFKMYKPNMAESIDEFELEDITSLMEDTESFIEGTTDMKSLAEISENLRLINKIKNSGVVKTGSMSKDKPDPAPVKKEAADLADLANEKIKDKKSVGEIPQDGERKFFKKKSKVIDDEDNIEEAAPKIKGDFLKIQRAKDAEHNAAMGRTKTGRKKPVRTMTSTQRSLASIAAKNEAFGRARFGQELKKKGFDVDKVHAKNVKDASDASERSKAAAKDLADFRKKHGMNEAQLDELSPETMMSYKRKADYSKDRAASSAAAKILRGKDKDGNRADHSPEVNTHRKRREGERLYNTRAADKLRKDLRKEATIPDGQTAFTKRPEITSDDKDKLSKIRAMMDKERANKNEAFEPHVMYDPETGKGYKADKEADHLRMKKMGYTHEKPEVKDEKFVSDAQRKAVWASKNDKKNEATVDEMDISVKSITKSGIRKAGDTPKLKADLKALRDRLNKDKGDGYGASKSLKASYGEECGAGEQGTPSLTKRLKKDTPNA